MTEPTSGNGHARRLGGEVLLPTPVVNDMGEGKTVQRWDEWTADLKGRHGNGHGPSLAIEAQRLLPTPVCTDARGARNSTAERFKPSTVNLGDTLGDVVYRGDIGDRLLPTPRATDGSKGGPNQRGSSGDVMLPAAVQPQRWGAYEAAVARWEAVTDRLAPSATEPGKNGQPRLSPAFVEWMMGLPPGHVTAVPDVPRAAQLKALGNGVVPQQAALAVAALLPSVPASVLEHLRTTPR